jgi:hypothetical protein
VSNLPLSLSICRERKLMVETDTVRVKALRAKCGQGYDFYCRRVNRWWPRRTGFAGSIKDMRLNWRRVLVKEYNTTFVLREWHSSPWLYGGWPRHQLTRPYSAQAAAAPSGNGQLRNRNQDRNKNYDTDEGCNQHIYRIQTSHITFVIFSSPEAYK